MCTWFLSLNSPVRCNFSFLFFLVLFLIYCFCYNIFFTLFIVHVHVFVSIIIVMFPMSYGEYFSDLTVCRSCNILCVFY